jgi:hypothetical protein
MHSPTNKKIVLLKKLPGKNWMLPDEILKKATLNQTSQVLFPLQFLDTKIRTIRALRVKNVFFSLK